MKKITSILLVFFLSNIFLNAQKSNDDFWNKLLNNDREFANSIFSENKLSTIETLIINEILREENGRFLENPNFITNFLKQDDFEYYLYALWNKTYIFDDYLDKGFSDKNRNIFKKINAANFKNSSIKDAIFYLNSVIAREDNNWEGYFALNDSIKAIKKWQYCGVFENLNKSGLDRTYLPETVPISEENFDAQSNGFVNWYTSNNTNEIYRFFTNHEEFGAGVNYAQTFINSKNDERVTLRIGSGSAFKLWLNDILIYENTEDVNTELNAHEIEITIPKGTNRLLFKLAESGNGSYFTVSVLKNNLHLTQIDYSSQYVQYNSSKQSDLNPKVLKNEFETFFINKIKNNPDEFLYKYCLVNTYLRNSKYKEAKDILNTLLKDYPKSSLLRKILMAIYNSEGETSKYNELKKNIELDDPEYYYHFVTKVAEYNELSRMSVVELEEFINKLKSKVDLELLHLTADIFYKARKEDLSGIINTLDEILEKAGGNVKMLLNLAPLYDRITNDDKKTLNILENLNKNYFNYSTIIALANYYDKKNENEKALKILSKDLPNLSNDNKYLSTFINKLQKYQKYDESLKFIDTALENFPYSFKMLELKGDALVQVGKVDEAITTYEQSLKFNSGNSSLRNKIRDLKNETNILKELAISDAYSHIKENRGKIKKNNYGYNILLDDTNVELFSEGGGKFKATYIYEITSDAGIEMFKEYNLGLSGNYFINKYELVKKDESIVPADKNRSNLVFNGLSIGDVIYIDYENSFSSSGRFYKDYVDKFMLDTYHPTVKTSLKIATPKGYPLIYKVINGKLDPKISKISNYDLYDWTQENLKGVEQVEDYMPADVDVIKYLHISTIPSWNDISIWYSDLVRASIEETSVVREAFNLIFPNGYSHLSQEERAKNIYNYIKNNFNYSYVSFRQSGFVPQRPTKTITTSLGDCKDFSTLYVTLANMAELESNLVLVLTSDYGYNDIVMPSTNFNHCIVKVKLNDKDQFLELTDKYLPFKSLPTSLRGATALEIPFKSDTNEKFDLFKIENVLREHAIIKNLADIYIGIEDIKMNLKTKITGHINSFYAGIFAEPNHEVVKKSIYDDLSGIIKEDFVLDELLNIERIDNDMEISFETKLTLSKKPNTIGSIKVLQLPTVSNPYTSHITSLESRNYPIDYMQYENLDEYYSTYNLYIDEGMSFIEIPKNRKITFKEHLYEISFELIKNNHLQVTLHAKPSLKRILPEDYLEFKTFIKSILEAEEAFIGFK
ncbi:MAG: transglutaminase domain-containing protein [Flavobacteriaceae bacterium]